MYKRAHPRSQGLGSRVVVKVDRYVYCWMILNTRNYEQVGRSGKLAYLNSTKKIRPGAFALSGSFAQGLMPWFLSDAKCVAICSGMPDKSTLQKNLNAGNSHAEHGHVRRPDFHEREQASPPAHFHRRFTSCHNTTLERQAGLSEYLLAHCCLLGCVLLRLCRMWCGNHAKYKK